MRLSHRYISGRQLPDKAISVLDTACAKVALGQNSTPALIESINKDKDRIETEIAALEREDVCGSQHGTRLVELRTKLDLTRAEFAKQSMRWKIECELADKIKVARQQMESTSQDSSAAAATDKESTKPVAHPHDSQAMHTLNLLLDELKLHQGDAPLVPVQVDGSVVAGIVAAWTGIPLGKMVKDEIKTVLNLDRLLQERVLGQSHATADVAQRVRTARANLDDPNKPKGVFLFIGPSGIGKTETALALADVLYGGEKKLVTINMSEYQEAHSVSGLKGSPPGYVGYGEGGVLTEAVRRNPYSVVLLDEVEKAHPDVLELFFQVFDKGVLDDAEGREIDFKNTIIILTSNVASAQMMQACLNKSTAELPSPEALEALIRPQLMKAFKPAFLGRLKVIPFYPIADKVLKKIIELKLSRIQKRIAVNHKATLSFDNVLIEAVLARCTEVDSGARNVDHILNGTLLPAIAETVLEKMASGSAICKIRVSASKKSEFKYLVQ